jgi:hypothetical protein
MEVWREAVHSVQRGNQRSGSVRMLIAFLALGPDGY